MTHLFSLSSVRPISVFRSVSIVADHRHSNKLDNTLHSSALTLLLLLIIASPDQRGGSISAHHRDKIDNMD